MLLELTGIEDVAVIPVLLELTLTAVLDVLFKRPALVDTAGSEVLFELVRTAVLEVLLERTALVRTARDDVLFEPMRTAVLDVLFDWTDPTLLRVVEADRLGGCTVVALRVEETSGRPEEPAEVRMAVVAFAGGLGMAGLEDELVELRRIVALLDVVRRMELVRLLDVGLLADPVDLLRVVPLVETVPLLEMVTLPVKGNRGGAPGRGPRVTASGAPGNLPLP